MENKYKQFTLNELSLIKQDQQIYYNFAKKYKLTEVELYIFEILFDADKPISQQTICTNLVLPKQTVHSAVKKLISKEYIGQNKVTNKNLRGIFLTEKGKEFSNICIKELSKLEELSAMQLSDEERDLYLKLYSKLVANKNKIFNLEDKEKNE